MTNDGHNGVSPEATGGAGTIDEYRFAAVNLVKLLRSDIASGLPVPVAAVGLQRREAGSLLDDVVLYAAPDSDAMRVEYQVKRTMSPTKSNKAFVDSLRQCLESLETNGSAIDAGLLRLGLATRSSGPVNQLHWLAETSRAHATLESFESIVFKPGVTDEDMRKRFDLVVETVALIQQERGTALQILDCRLLTFNLLRATHIWQFEVGPDGRDTTDAANRLADILPPGDHIATTAVSQLADIAQTWGTRAGLISQAMLRAELERHGVALTVEPKQRAALKKLAEATKRELDATPWKIAGRLELPRVLTLHRIKDAVATHAIVLVSGPAGVGKSVLARRAVKELGTTATTVVINLAGRGRESLVDLHAEFGADLAAALPTAATTGPRILLIDGAEHALVDNGRLLTAVLNVVPRDPATAPAWTVVLTARTEAIDVIRRHLGAAPLQVNISEVDDEEVAAIVREFPQLTSLTQNARSRRLLRRPYLVDLLVRANAQLDDDRVLGEEDVMVHVWDHVVRREEGARTGVGSPHDRAVACSALAEESARTATGSALSSADGDAIRGLLSDDVLVRHRTRYRFAHDILLDYSLAMRLLEDDHTQLLSQVDELRRLIRAVRLTLQRRLGDVVNVSSPDAIREWKSAVQLAEDLAAQNGGRWRDLPYEALLSMGNPRPLLHALKPALLANDGAQLLHLLQVTRRFTTTSNRGPEGDGPQLDVLLAAPVVDFLGVIGHGAPRSTTYLAADVVHQWLLSAARTGTALDDYLTDPPGLSRAAAMWAEDDTYGDRLKAVLRALALLGLHFTTEARAVFDRLAEHNDELSVIVEEPDVAAAAAAASPDLLLLVAGRYYLDQSLTLDRAQTRAAGGRRRRRTRALWIGGEDEDGVRDHLPRFRRRDKAGLAAPHYGPFSALLESSPAHGLRLVGAVVDAATASRTAVERRFGHGDPVLKLKLVRPGWDESITFHGTAATWCWFRRASNGAYPAMSALMALAEWALRESQERPLGDVIDQVLTTSRSLAVVAVAVALLIARLDAVNDEFDPFFEHPLIWHLENSRHVHESSGLAYPLTGYTRLDWQPVQVAMALALRSDEAGRERLRAVGERLIQQAGDELLETLGETPGEDHPDLLTAQSWGRALDYSAYQVMPSEIDGMVEIDIKLPEHVKRGLQRDGANANLNLAVASITNQAVQIRDGESDAVPDKLWDQLADALQQLEGRDENDMAICSPSDAQAAVASAVIITVIQDRGSGACTHLMKDAVAALLEAVEDPPEQDLARHSTDRTTGWPTGADRSAATALSRLLATPTLHKDLQHVLDRAKAAIQHLADSPSAEVRQRLAQGLNTALCEPCSDEPGVRLHDFAVATLKHMILNRGMGPWNDSGRARTVLTEPLREALGPGNDVLHIGEAADVIPALATAVRLSCRHGKAVADVMQALTDHDIMAWPNHYARRTYHDITLWRANLDRHVAREVLNGDQDLLARYLDRFAPVAEELHGLLVELAVQATTTARGKLLFEMYWPLILDRLLPTNRNLRTDGESDHPHYQHVAALDRALLPLPNASQSWPRESLLGILERWIQAFKDRPQVADHAITVIAEFGLLASPLGTASILRLLGTDIDRIQQYSQLTSVWLHVVLITDKEASQQHKPQLLELVDRLADAGDILAIELQRDLELQ